MGIESFYGFSRPWQRAWRRFPALVKMSVALSGIALAGVQFPALKLLYPESGLKAGSKTDR